MAESIRTQIKWNSDEEYVAVRVPDKMLIASILSEARGKRTMAEFADACKVSASTLSRVLNGKLTKPMSIDLIRNIAEHAESTSATLFERLARANGLMPKKQFEENKDRVNEGIFSRIEVRRNLYTKARNIVMNELVKRGLIIKIINQRDADINSSYGQSLPHDFAIETDLGNGLIKWSFLIVPYTISDIVGDGRLPAGIFLRRTVQNMSGWFLTDAWEPESLENRLHTFLFIDSAVYVFFEDPIVCGPLVNSDFSFVTLDMEKEKVNFEIYMGRKDKKKHELIFGRPVIEDYVDKDETWQIHEDAAEYIVSGNLGVE